MLEQPGRSGVRDHTAALCLPRQPAQARALERRLDARPAASLPSRGFGYSFRRRRSGQVREGVKASCLARSSAAGTAAPPAITQRAAAC
eukprot:5277423-Pyramimonas_sp.AAC.1